MGINLVNITSVFNLRLQKSNDLLQVLIKFPTAVFQADSDLNLLFLNERGKKVTGYTDEDIEKGLNGFDIFVAEEHEQIKENIRNIASGSDYKFFEHNVKKKDGTILPVNIYVIPLIQNEQIKGFWGIALDISERKSIEERTRRYSEHLETLVDERTSELRESEKKYRFLTDQMNDIIWTLDMTLKTTYVSPSIEKVLGYTPEERKKQAITEQLTPDSLTHTSKILSEELQKEANGGFAPERYTSIEVEYYHKDGSTRWCENLISGIRDDAGVLIGFHGVTRDITERKKAEEKLLESIKWSRSIFNGVIDAIFIVDEDLDYIDVNRAAIRLTQFSNDELVQMNMKDMHDTEYLGKLNEFFTRVSKGETIRDVSEILRKDCEKVPVEYRISGINIQDGKYLLLVANDLTLRRRYQERLEVLYEIALKMAEANSLDNVADLCLSAISEVLKYSLCTFSLVEDDYIKFRYNNQDNIIKEIPLEETGITVRAVKTGEIQLVPDVNKDPDYLPHPGYKIGSELAVPIKVDGHVRALINVESEKIDAFSQDDRDHVATLAELISNALHRLDTKEYLEQLVEERTEELKKLNEELVHLGEMKKQFVNHVTHELRTPLTSIKGYLEIMESIHPSDRVESSEKFFTILQRNTDRLVSLTDDLIEQQRLDSHKMRLDLSSTILKDIIVQSVENISPMMNQKKQTFTTEYDESIPALYIDPIRIGQVMDNLLSNAIKYSPEETNFHISAINQENEIKLSVRDEGIGLSKNDIDELFKPFPSIARPPITENSTGLGLCICKGIIELHDGKIWAESDGKGEGSTFKFTIPKN